MKAISLLIFLTLVTIMSEAQERLYITVNDVTHSIVLSDTEAAKELKKRVNAGNVTVTMNDYGGFEKVGELPWALPTSNRQISTVPGDVMLYQGNNIVIFYGTNSWSYTSLGKIEGMTSDEIRNFLAGSHIEATLSANFQSGVSDVKADHSENPAVSTLQGVKIDMRGRTPADLAAGVYILNGKKYLIK
ncbi:MAG: hypothetical protein K2N09_09950 [Muribaculaceae bacterium]|nr:hypothetical protein [Muribaculaceae bacterium]